MATYNPPAFPRRPGPKQSNIFTEMRYQIQLAHFRYEINTAQYVMSPGEKLAFNLTVLSLLLLFVSAVYYYLPRSALVGLRRLAYYFTGSHRLHLSAVDMTQNVLHSTMEAAASLADKGGVVNASSALAP